MHVSYTGSFSDPSLMSKQATQYVAEKADVLTGSSQSVVGAITVAKANNVAWFGTQWTQASLAPEAGRVVPGLRLDGDPRPDADRHPGRQARRSTYTITLGNGGEKIQFNPGYKLPASIKARPRRRSPGSRTARSRSSG